jgi:putative intracellular protease/amidase
MKQIIFNIRPVLLLPLFMLVLTKAKAQQKEIFKVAIFLYEGVELLDFAGPGEVFAATPGFDVYTVSADGKEVLSQHFVTIKPQYSIDNAPPPDIFIFPGGNSIPSSKHPKVINWIKERVAAGTMCISVCSGANIVAQTGLLDGLNVTTWYGNIPHLKATLPNSNVLENTRFVDNGNIITTAGVSAGIDGALHVVSRIKGLEVAKATAHYMEYDKWKPEDGKRDYENGYIRQMRAARYKVNDMKNVIKNGSVPYEGELINLANELWGKGLYKHETELLYQAIKWYPNSSSFYNLITQVNMKLGKPAPIDEASFVRLIKFGKIEEAQLIHDKTQKDFPGWKLFDENTLNAVAYDFLNKGDAIIAIKIFQLNVNDFPRSWNAWDSIGEAYMKAGNKKEAIASYKQSLALNAANTNAIEKVKSLE